MPFNFNCNVLRLLLVAAVSVVVLAASGKSYLDDPLLQRIAAESHGALKPITNLRSRTRFPPPLTAPGGVSLEDFHYAAPRANGPVLDASLIAIEMRAHNLPLGRILTATGGVDVSNASVILSSPRYFNDDIDAHFPPLVVNVSRKQTSNKGGPPWWIEAYDQAITAAIEQKYGTFGIRAKERENILPYIATGFSSWLGNSTIARRHWNQMLITRVTAKDPLVVITSDLPTPGDNDDYPYPSPPLLKFPHAYAVEAIEPGTEYKKQILTITLRDAETATKGVTYNYTDVNLQLHDMYWLEPNRPPE